VEFSKNQPKEGTPETEFRQTPDRSFFRKFFNDRLRFPDGFETEVWSFESEDSGHGFPAPLIRVREGEILQVTLKPGKGPHTIHHHGLEPDPRNDGAGHSSFEVTGEYTYQFDLARSTPGNPNNGCAGSYFYHCHVNTVLHVQMGMFGPLIIDPPTGRGKAFVDDPVGYDPRAETLLVPYEIDPRWHELGHAAGLGGEDVGLNRFEPSRFYLLGGNLNAAPEPGTVAACNRILVPPPGGRPGLLRVLNASYFPTIVRFGEGMEAECIAHDGRPFRNTSVSPSPPVSVFTRALAFGAAERYDLRVRPPAGAQPGDTFPVTVEFRHWVTGEIAGTATAVIEVIEPEELPGPDSPSDGGAQEGGGSAADGSSGPGGGGSPGPASPAVPRRRRRRRRRRSRRGRRRQARRRRRRRSRRRRRR
jgi:FtsP/CotA-like multicopper oxidase with cupredoxin domain